MAVKVNGRPAVHTQGHGGAEAAASRSRCPVCGLPSRDQAAARLGFCDQCREFTGMCAAGRTIICPDVLTRTSWHSPCTQLGDVAWQIWPGGQPPAKAAGPAIALLCRGHDGHVRSGGTPWLTGAVPLAIVTEPGRSRPRRLGRRR
jgi:hypothetical protein